MSRSQSPIDDPTPALPPTAQSAAVFVHPERKQSIAHTAGNSTGDSTSGPVSGSQDTREEPAPKRQRTMNTEEKKRGQRLFGNLLGQLNRFTKEEKTKAASDRAKAREEIASRVANKLQGESQRVQEINGLEREVRSCRNEYERLQNGLREAEMNTKARARQLPQVSRFLLTTSSWTSKSPETKTSEAVFMALGPARDPVTAAQPKPLFYRPRKLTSEQRDILDKQEDLARDLVATDRSELEVFRADTKAKLASLSERRTNAQEQLDGLKRKDEEKKVGDLAKSMEVDQDIKVESIKAEETKKEPESEMDIEVDDGGLGGREGDEVEY